MLWFLLVLATVLLQKTMLSTLPDLSKTWLFDIRIIFWFFLILSSTKQIPPEQNLLGGVMILEDKKTSNSHLIKMNSLNEVDPWAMIVRVGSMCNTQGLLTIWRPWFEYQGYWSGHKCNICASPIGCFWDGFH